MLKQATGLDEDALAFTASSGCRLRAGRSLPLQRRGHCARRQRTWYFGGNMEFLGATMQQTVHAEQSAISHAWLRGEKSPERDYRELHPAGTAASL